MKLEATLKHSCPTMSLGIIFNNKEEVQKAYKMLSIGGNILFPLGSLPWSECAADVVDKFGVCWYIAVYYFYV
jgi:PhnB protein